MKNPWRLICLLLPVTLALIACGGGQGNGSSPLYQDVAGQVTEYIEEQMVRERVTGLSLALVDGQSLIWAGGFGLADAENRKSVDRDTVFEIGSLSKTITAAMIMRQVELGHMSLDDPLADHVPAWNITQRFEDSGPITIRTLLTHHAGIPGDILPGAFSLEFDPDAFNGWLMNELAKDYTTFPTNYRWAYSNSALVMAGQALADVCGHGFIQCGDRFLLDLGMSNSSFGPRPDLESRLSKGYYFGREVGRYYCNIPAAGGVWSTIGDMARYISFILGRGLDVLKPDSIRQMLTVQNGDVPLDPGMETGLTWLLSDTWAGLLASHTGGTAAHWSQVLILPEHDLGVVALTNSKNGLNLITQASYLALELAVKAKTGLTPPPAPQPVYSPPAQWTAEQLQAVAGVYSTGSGFDSFKPETEGLSWAPYGQGTAIFLIPRENGRFSPPEHQEYELEFAEVAGRRSSFCIRSRMPLFTPRNTYQFPSIKTGATGREYIFYPIYRPMTCPISFPPTCVCRPNRWSFAWLTDYWFSKPEPLAIN